MINITHVEDVVCRWHIALFRDLIAGRILPVQFLAGIEIANEWGLERYEKLFSKNTETDLCTTTSF